MARSDRVRYQLFLPRALAERFDALAARPGGSKSSLLAAAVAALLDKRGAGELDNRFAARLDTLTRQTARIERNGQVQIESFALFVRYMLMVTPPLADEDEAGRALGHARFETFLARVARELASGRSTLDPTGAGNGAIGDKRNDRTGGEGLA